MNNGSITACYSCTGISSSFAQLMFTCSIIKKAKKYKKIALKIVVTNPKRGSSKSIERNE